MALTVVDLGACRAARRRGEPIDPLPRFRLVADVGDVVDLVDGTRGAVTGYINAPSLEWTIDCDGTPRTVWRNDFWRNLSTGALLGRPLDPPAAYAASFERAL